MNSSTTNQIDENPFSYYMGAIYIWMGVIKQKSPNEIKTKIIYSFNAIKIYGILTDTHICVSIIE